MWEEFQQQVSLSPGLRGLPLISSLDKQPRLRFTQNSLSCTQFFGFSFNSGCCLLVPLATYVKLQEMLFQTLFENQRQDKVKKKKGNFNNIFL
jgi:hypothetical protein